MTNIVSKEETILKPLEINTEIDTETMADCITRSDNTLIVNYPNNTTYLSYPDDTI